jgi:peptidoglycan/xylan/chitin deacetylase (PgdA/CDA1 family)
MNSHLINLIVAFLSLCALLTAGVFHDSYYLDFIPVPVFIFLGIAAWGSMNIQSGYHIKAFCNGSREKAKIALTYDDGPSGENTEKVLDVLKSEKTPATFFLIGRNIANKESQIKRIIKEGHEIGSHSYQHDFWYDLKRKKFYVEDLNKNKEIIEKISSKPLQYFRPPYGVTTPALSDAIKEKGYQCIGWDVRSYDTRGEKTDKILERILQQVQNGSIILLHDTLENSAELTKKLIISLKEKKFEIVSLKELIHEKSI